jgi:hypothetical protein
MRFAGPNALSTRNGRAVVEAANDRDHLGNCEGYLSLNSSRLRRSCAAPESSPVGIERPTRHETRNELRPAIRPFVR